MKQETITLILSILGALAWFPIIGSAVIDHFRKLRIVPLDSRVLTNAEGISAGKKSKKTGTILMLALNIFIKKTTIFAKSISLTVILKNKTKLQAELLDFATLSSNNNDGTTSVFVIPEGLELNSYRTIRADEDNLKFVAFLVESGMFQSIDDIEKLEISVQYGIWFKKKVTVTNEDFPRFNSTRLLEKYEVTR